MLKVCLNHYFTKDISFEKRGDKTLSWAATDFSENEASPELFALRFKTSEFANEFLAAIENAMKITEKPSSNVDVSKAAASFSFKADTAPKTDFAFTPGSLTSIFGTSAAPAFGTSSEALFSFKDKSSSSTFFKTDSMSESKEADKSFKFGTGKISNIM